MWYTSSYLSPIGRLLLAADETGLTGVWFEGGKYFAAGLPAERAEGESGALAQARRWLDIYFSGQVPGFMPPVHLIGTPFQTAVWELLRQIPYGQTVTYGSLAKALARGRGLAQMSAQAVGGAVGRNKLSIIIPCHRVVGADGSLTGYAGGLDKKIALLTLEGAMDDGFYVPKRSTAP